MSQFRSEDVKNSSSAEKFNSILDEIIVATLKVSEIIKSIEQLETKEVDISFIDDINCVYQKRYLLVMELMSIFDNTLDKEDILINNPLLDKYNNEIINIEQDNLDFLNQKTIETKYKLSKIANNKSVLLYNPKIKLSYENKLI